MKFFKYFLIKKQIKFKQINDFYYENENFNFIYENNLYEINFEWINKILYHVPISHLMEKNYTSIINSNRNHLISNINSNINKYVECILLQCEIIKDYEIDIIYLLNSNILENILKYEIVNKMTTIISDINKVNNFSWEYLLEKQKIEPSANNIKACIENKDLDNIIIQRYINNLTIYTKIFNSKCKYTNEDIDNFRFEDIMFDSENINPNVFEAFLTSIDTIYSDFFEDQSKDFLSIIIKMKKVETNINTYIYLINQNYISLAIKLLENNPYILIENFALFNLSSEILMNLIKSNNLNNNQKISLLNFSNTNNISGYQDIIEILYNLKIENFKLLKNEFFDILLCSILEENKKIELFLQYNFKSREEVTKYLLNINHNFESLTKLSTKKLKIKKTEFLLKLISKLNNINYISSFKEHKYDIEINTFRTNKDIFI